MKKCCFIVAFAILLSVIAPSIPAYAASEPINVMLGADCIRTVNVDTNKYSASQYGGVSDPSKMTDELYGVGPTNKDEGFNARTIDKWIFYDADGNEDLYNGEYLWSVTFDLNGKYTIDTLSLMTMDLTPFIGDTDPVQWLQRGFDILVSDTGLAGSWRIAHRAEDLHTEDDPGEYTYHAPTDDFPMGYYQYDATFDAVEARYIQFGCTDYTSYTMEQSHWINISELEIYTVGDTPSVPTVPAEEGNVMRNATFVRGVNFREDIYVSSQYGGVCGPEKVTDGRYGVGPSQVDDGFNSKMIELAWYDLAGNKDEDAFYLWYMIFQLDDEYTVDRFSLITNDLTTCGIGDTNPVQWLQWGFDILVSETGEADSWEVVYINAQAHTETDKGDYQYIAPTEERPLGYYQLDGSFAPVKARYICFASTSPTSFETSTWRWINISELQVYEYGSGLEPDQPIPTPPVNERNVMTGAVWSDSVNLRASEYKVGSDGTKSDPSKMIDGKWAMESTCAKEGLNTRIDNLGTRYDADNNLTSDGYRWSVTFMLDQMYEVDSFRLINLDMTGRGIGNSHTIQWFQRDFDILVSETGLNGSWKVVYEGRNLHQDTSSIHYDYHPGTATNLPYYDLSSDFTEPTRAHYVKFASLSYTTEILTTNHWINISELQVFGDPVTDPGTPEPPQEPLPLPSGVNVMQNACWSGSVNLRTKEFRDCADGSVSDPSRMIDGVWAQGPAVTDEGLSTRIDQLWTYYNADGFEDDNGPYMWTTTFALDREYSVNGFRLITMDMTESIGDTRMIQWLQQDFDILVSDIGVSGTWEVVYSGRNLHSENSAGAYRYQEAADGKLAYYELIEEFTATEGIRYIMFASRSHTSDVMNSAYWINISEWEVYGEALPAETVDSGECSETISWELNEFGTLYISGTGCIPDWEYLQTPWKDYFNTATAVIIDEGITEIGNYSFAQFATLRSAKIPAGITRIGNNAFSACDALSVVRLPGTVKELGTNAFAHCSKLREIIIPASISIIPEKAFYYSGLHSVILREGITKIDKNAFAECYQLTEMHIPKSVTQIAEQAFEGCRNMLAFTVDSENGYYKSDEVGALLTKDGKTLIQYPAGKIVDAYAVADTVTRIASYAFGGSRISSLHLPAGVAELGYYALPNSMTKQITILNDSVDLSLNTIAYGATIYGHAGSTAEAYAKQFNYTFVVISRGGVDGQIRIYHPRTAVHVRLLQGETEVYTATLTPTAGSDTVSFSFRDVSAGTYDMKIDGDGLLPYTIRGIVVADAVVDLTAHENEAISTITPAAGDIDGNGFIDLADVVLLTSESTYGRSYEDARTKSADVNGDGIFDLQDLAIVTSESGYGRSAILVDFH